MSAAKGNASGGERVRRAQKRAARKPTAPDRAALESALQRALPGLEILDRALVLEGRATCDLVARERAGRLVLVRYAPAGEDQAALAALDLLGAALAARESIAAHIESLGAVAAGVCGARETPRAILVLDRRAGAELARRLAPLAAAGLELATPLAAASSLGTTLALSLERAGPAPTGGLSGPGVEGFLSALAPARRELALLALRRIERVDEALERRASVEALAFRHAGRALCELVAEGGELVGRLADGARLELRGGPDLDRFLERVLGALVGEDALDDPRRGRPGVGPDSPRRPERERLREHDLVPHSTEALLTPEELEAFRS